MKYAKIVRSYTALCGRVLPLGSIYGRIPCTFRHSVGYRDKSGRVHRRASKKIRDVTYYIPRPESCAQNGAVWFYFYDYARDKWVESNTKYVKAYQAIYDAVLPILQDMDYLALRSQDITTLTAPCQRREIPKSGQRGVPGYATNPHIMTGDINAARRACVRPTNHVR